MIVTTAEAHRYAVRYPPRLPRFSIYVCSRPMLTMNPFHNARTSTRHHRKTGGHLTSPSSLTANAALSLVVTDTMRRPHRAAALCATHSSANGLVLASSSGSTWLSWLSVNISPDMSSSGGVPSSRAASPSLWQERQGRGNRTRWWDDPTFFENTGARVRSGIQRIRLCAAHQHWRTGALSSRCRVDSRVQSVIRLLESATAETTKTRTGRETTPCYERTR